MTSGNWNYPPVKPPRARSTESIRDEVKESLCDELEEMEREITTLRRDLAAAVAGARIDAERAAQDREEFRNREAVCIAIRSELAAAVAAEAKTEEARAYWERVAGLNGDRADAAVAERDEARDLVAIMRAEEETNERMYRVAEGLAKVSEGITVAVCAERDALAASLAEALKALKSYAIVLPNADEWVCDWCRGTEGERNSHARECILSTPAPARGAAILEVVEKARVMADHVLGTAALPDGYEPDARGDVLGFRRAMAIRDALRALDQGTPGGGE